ncbi:MAG TPA: TIGR02996 domain-containing protein [Gemmataceae bacterium]|jgi:uncharacterized protein (TIGR02996 family)
MASTQQALFQAICEQPWDTSLRLAYANWLEKNGQAQWAAFVRYQCQNPDHSLNHFQARYLFDLFDEVGEFDPFESDWLKKLPKLPGVSWWGSDFKGGFVHNVGFRPATAFLEHAATVFASTPIDSVVLELLTVPSLREILTSSFLSRLESLALYGHYGDEGMRLLAACPNLTRLKWLHLMEDGCGDEGAEALAGSPYLGNLQNLYFIRGHQVGDRGALALAKSPNLGNVRFLVFDETERLSQPVVDELKRRFQYLDGWPTQG